MSAPNTTLADLAFAREYLVVASDRLCALAASLRDLGLDKVEDGLVLDQVMDTMLAVWTARWELGMMPGDVQESDEPRRTAEGNRELIAVRSREPVRGGRR